MTALTLLNRHLNQLDTDFRKPFLSPVWIRETDAAETTAFGFATRMKYDEEASTWNLTVEVAGVAKENMKVDAKDNYLTITGEKTKGVELGKFEKNFRLPEGVDVEKIEAAFEDGILTVQLPLESKRASKAIPIK